MECFFVFHSFDFLVQQRSDATREGPGIFPQGLLFWFGSFFCYSSFLLVVLMMIIRSRTSSGKPASIEEEQQSPLYYSSPSRSLDIRWRTSVRTLEGKKYFYFYYTLSIYSTTLHMFIKYDYGRTGPKKKKCPPCGDFLFLSEKNIKIQNKRASLQYARRTDDCVARRKDSKKADEREISGSHFLCLSSVICITADRQERQRLA